MKSGFWLQKFGDFRCPSYAGAWPAEGFGGRSVWWGKRSEVAGKQSAPGGEQLHTV